MQRTTQGVELSKMLLKILAGSIFILVAYLWFLDDKTSDKADELYDKVFSSIQPRTSFPEANEIAGVVDTFRATEREPPPRLSVADVSRTAAAIKDIASRFQVPGDDAANLDQCVQRAASPPNAADARSASAPTGAASAPPAPGAPTPSSTRDAAPETSSAPLSSTHGEAAAAPSAASRPAAAQGATAPPPPSPSPVTPPTSTAGESASPASAQGAASAPLPAPNSATTSAAETASPKPTPSSPAAGEGTNPKIENCIRILDALRDKTGASLDIERLRVMRDFAKDVHDNHQAFRTFWISAAQLVLVNVLLPLISGLFGYIFGRQSSQSPSS